MSLQRSELSAFYEVSFTKQELEAGKASQRHKRLPTPGAPAWLRRPRAIVSKRAANAHVILKNLIDPCVPVSKASDFDANRNIII